MIYQAFIAYSPTVDRDLAPAMQLGLERLARPWYRTRAGRVFRDDTPPAVSPNTWAAIVRAIEDSDWFVVLCSRDAATSHSVACEIAHWLVRNGSDRILLALTDGELAWDRARSDFDPERSTALPGALLGQFPHEPRYVDLRWARSHAALDMRDPRFRAAIAQLAAPVRGVARYELEDDDLWLRRRLGSGWNPEAPGPRALRRDRKLS